MVAYSFQPSFIPLLLSGVKRQTIRIPRKREPRVGEALQFFTGPRMRPTRIGGATCLAVRDVRLDFEHDEVTLDDAEVLTQLEELNAFATRDGFGHRLCPSAWEHMARWWAYTHSDQPIFRGTLVDFGDTFTPAIPVAA